MGSISALHNNIQTVDQNLLASIEKSFENMYEKLDKRFNEIQGHLEVIKNNFTEVNSKIESIQDDIEMHRNQMLEIQSEINYLNQQKMQNQIVIYGFPVMNDNFNVIECINSFFNIKISSDDIKKNYRVKIHKSNLNNIYLEFWNEKFTYQLLAQVRKKQRDPSGKFIPILVEHLIPQLPLNDIRRGTQINFKIPMTKINREILNTARQSKMFKYVWIERTGCIKVRKDEKTKAIKVSSMMQLKSLLPNNME